MEIKLISKQKNMMKIEIIDADETILEPLKIKLLEDDDVEYANYFRKHPLLDNPVLIVKVKKGKPQGAIKRAAKAIATEYEEMMKFVEKYIEKKK